MMSAEGEPTAYSVPEAFPSVTLIHSSKAKKKMKKIQRLTVAELKQLVKKPEVVEASMAYSCYDLSHAYSLFYKVVGCNSQ